MKTSTAVQVLVYVQPDGAYMYSVFERKWNGAWRWDRRMTSARRLAEIRTVPVGVEPVLWMAYMCIGQLVWSQAELKGEVTGH